jgi:putative heme-binding domain-containing protein
VALDEALRERQADTLAPSLVQIVVTLADHDPVDMTLTRLAARAGSRPAMERARAIVANGRAVEQKRLAMLDLMGELKDRGSVGLLLNLTTQVESATVAIRDAAFGALGQFDDPSIASTLLMAYPRKDHQAWRSRARELLLSRISWARAYLAAIDRGDLIASEVTLDQLGRFATLRDPKLAALVRKHWGVTRGTTREERLAEVRRLNNDLRAAIGDTVRGRQLFREHCATCHRLFGEGETIGPDLTHANRHDRDFLLVSLVDPAGVVRKEYQAYNLATKDGRIVSGLIVEQTPDVITLRGAKGERTRVARSQIEDLKEMETSLMPESLYKEFGPQQLRDLFSYLQTEGRKVQP